MEILVTGYVFIATLSASLVLISPAHQKLFKSKVYTGENNRHFNEIYLFWCIISGVIWPLWVIKNINRG
jgi:hypothetical protein